MILGIVATCYALLGVASSSSIDSPSPFNAAFEANAPASATPASSIETTTETAVNNGTPAETTVNNGTSVETTENNGTTRGVRFRLVSRAPPGEKFNISFTPEKSDIKEYPIATTFPTIILTPTTRTETSSSTQLNNVRTFSVEADTELASVTDTQYSESQSNKGAAASFVHKNNTTAILSTDHSRNDNDRKLKNRPRRLHMVGKTTNEFNVRSESQSESTVGDHQSAEQQIPTNVSMFKSEASRIRTGTGALDANTMESDGDQNHRNYSVYTPTNPSALLTSIHSPLNGTPPPAKSAVYREIYDTNEILASGRTISFPDRKREAKFADTAAGPAEKSHLLSAPRISPDAARNSTSQKANRYSRNENTPRRKVRTKWSRTQHLKKVNLAPRQKASFPGGEGKEYFELQDANQEGLTTNMLPRNSSSNLRTVRKSSKVNGGIGSYDDSGSIQVTVDKKPSAEPSQTEMVQLPFYRHNINLRANSEVDKTAQTIKNYFEPEGDGDKGRSKQLIAQVRPLPPPLLLPVPPAPYLHAGSSQLLPASASLPHLPPPLLVSAYPPGPESSPNYINGNWFGDYNYGYGVADDHRGTYFGHVESKKGSLKEGRYYVDMPDGRRMIVAYYADHTGYYPTVSYEKRPTNLGTVDISLKQRTVVPPISNSFDHRGPHIAYPTYTERLHDRHRTPPNTANTQHVISDDAIAQINNGFSVHNTYTPNTNSVRYPYYEGHPFAFGFPRIRYVIAHRKPFRRFLAPPNSYTKPNFNINAAFASSSFANNGFNNVKLSSKPSFPVKGNEIQNVGPFFPAVQQAVPTHVTQTAINSSPLHDSFMPNFPQLNGGFSNFIAPNTNAVGAITEQNSNLRPLFADGHSFASDVASQVIRPTSVGTSVMDESNIRPLTSFGIQHTLFSAHLDEDKKEEPLMTITENIKHVDTLQLSEQRPVFSINAEKRFSERPAQFYDYEDSTFVIKESS